MCWLKCSIYGLKQSSRCWNSTSDGYLKQLGFLQSNCNPCVYTMAVDEMIVVGIYVDYIVVACKSEVRLKELKQDLCRKFDVKDLGNLYHFLGLKVAQDEVSGDVWVGQSAYVGKVLERFGMEKTKSVVTPVDTSTKLVKAVEDDEMQYISQLLAACYICRRARGQIWALRLGMWLDSLLITLNSLDWCQENSEVPQGYI